MMNLSCEHCGKEGTLEEQVYSGKRLRLKCPYCAASFITKVPGNGNRIFGAAADLLSAPSDLTVAAVMTSAPPVPDAAEAILTQVAEEQPAVDVPAAAEAPPPEVDEAVVHEAKRIARLIISEIKLYNQDKIIRARNKREVLELLKHDLIKGKQHYNSRIASKLPSGPDYFMETVKEILLAGKS